LIGSEKMLFDLFAIDRCFPGVGLTLLSKVTCGAAEEGW
jgi:hypothetical protein